MSLARRAATAVLCAALMLVAACSGSSSRPTPPRTILTAQAPTTKAYTNQVAARQRATVAYAQQLVDHAPQVAGEKPLTTAPPHNLQRPDETIGAPDLVIRARYWTAPGTADHVYRALMTTPVDGLTVSGHGLPSSPAEDLPGRGFLNYPLLDPPPYIEGGELYMEMEPSGPGRTVIAAYGEVYSHPVRYPIEHISRSGGTATATWPRIEQDKVIAHPSEALAPDQLAAFIDGFNRSPVAANNVCFGGFRLAGDVLTVTIRSAGHIWRLTYPGTGCGGLAVSRDGVQLPAITPDANYNHLLRVLSHSSGTVAGHLVLVGGPAGAASTPVAGTAIVSANGRTVATVHTRNARGYFSLTAPSGRYTLSGSSRSYQIDGHPGRCTATHEVAVRTDQTTHADVYCQRR